MAVALADYFFIAGLEGTEPTILNLGQMTPKEVSLEPDNVCLA